MFLRAHKMGRTQEVIKFSFLNFLKYENIIILFSLSIEKYRCNLRWADARTLLIGWVDTVRVCIIRKRSNIELANKNLPEYLVDPGD